MKLLQFLEIEFYWVAESFNRWLFFCLGPFRCSFWWLSLWGLRLSNDRYFDLQQQYSVRKHLKDVNTLCFKGSSESVVNVLTVWTQICIYRLWKITFRQIKKWFAYIKIRLDDCLPLIFCFQIGLLKTRFARQFYSKWKIIFGFSFQGSCFFLKCLCIVLSFVLDSILTRSKTSVTMPPLMIFVCEIAKMRKI